MLALLRQHGGLPFVVGSSERENLIDANIDLIAFVKSIGSESDGVADTPYIGPAIRDMLK